jgi:hypothetical protein
MSAAPLTLRGMAPDTAQTYALMHIVPPEVAEDQPVLERFMQTAIADRVAAEGYDVVPGTFEMRLIERARIDGDPMLTQEEVDAGMTGDELVARATVQCRPRG